MAEEKDGIFVQVVGSDDQRESIFGQDTEAVKEIMRVLTAYAAALGHRFGYHEAGSAFLSGAVNYMLSLYTVDSVREILEGVLPNLQAMHDDLKAAWLESIVDKGNPQ